MRNSAAQAMRLNIRLLMNRSARQSMRQSVNNPTGECSSYQNSFFNSCSFSGLNTKRNAPPAMNKNALPAMRQLMSRNAPPPMRLSVRRPNPHMEGQVEVMDPQVHQNVLRCQSRTVNR